MMGEGNIIIHLCHNLLTDPKNVGTPDTSDVKLINGRLPRNSIFADATLYFPDGSDLAKYNNKGGVPVSREGFMDFSAHIVKGADRKPLSVNIDNFTTRSKDFNEAWDLVADRLPKNLDRSKYTWHHSEDKGVVQLVPRDLHDGVPHTGGFAQYSACAKRVVTVTVTSMVFPHLTQSAMGETTWAGDLSNQDALLMDLNPGFRLIDGVAGTMQMGAEVTGAVVNEALDAKDSTGRSLRSFSIEELLRGFSIGLD